MHTVFIILILSVTSVICAKQSFQTINICSSGVLIINKLNGGPPGKANNYDGIISIAKWPNLSYIKLILHLSVPAKVRWNVDGGVTESSENSFLLSYNGRPYFQEIRFSVSGHPKQAFPQPIGLTLNDVDICTQSDEQHVTNTPVSTTQTPFVKPTNPPIHGIDDRFDDNTCGKRLVNHQGLITNGYPSQEGDWPWHTAIYHKRNSSDYSYKCGGTLISEKSVLTAAHCVTENGYTIIPERLYVKLGLHNRLLAGRNTQEFQVYEIIVHDKYDTNDLKNDIAILKLATQAILTKFVQPVCVWPENLINLENVINKQGLVIGWGLNEQDALTDILTQGSMPVVSLTTCLESNRDFFGIFLTDYNYCAGFRNGTSVCNGDSGGGMFFVINNIYYIRGIVSLSVAHEEKDICNPKHYVIFTDIAKYLNFIYANIK